jgi:hypothetical protein
MAEPSKRTADASLAIEDRGARPEPPTSVSMPSSASSSASSGSTGEPGQGADTRTLMSKVRDRAGEGLTTQKNRAVEGVSSVAHAVRQTAAHLREDNREPIAKYAESGAQQLERLSEFLRNTDGAELWREAQTYARRRPAVFVGSAFVIGLMAARFLKSSGARSTRPPTWQRTTTDRTWDDQIAGRRGTS